LAAKAPKGRNILAMGEARRNGNANPSQALKGRNDQAKGKARGAGTWPFIPDEDNSTPSEVSSWAWIRFLQSLHPFGIGSVFEAIHHL